MLAKIDGINMVEHEVKFHRSCLRKYTVPLRPKGDSLTVMQVHMKAFEFLVEYVDTHIIQGGNVELMTTLVEKYMKYIKNIAPSRMNVFYKFANLNDELKQRYGDRLRFWEENIVYSSNLTMCEGIEKFITLRVTEIQRLEDAALVLHRRVIDAVKSAPEDMLSTRISGLERSCALKPPPPILVDFINQVITGNVAGSGSNRFERISNSIAEQITYVCTDSV